MNGILVVDPGFPEEVLTPKVKKKPTRVGIMAAHLPYRRACGRGHACQGCAWPGECACLGACMAGGCAWWRVRRRVVCGRPVDRQTPVKILPCLKLRFGVVNMLDIFPENCMKLKKIYIKRGHESLACDNNMLK